MNDGETKLERGTQEFMWLGQIWTISTGETSLYYIKINSTSKILGLNYITLTLYTFSHHPKNNLQ